MESQQIIQRLAAFVNESSYQFALRHSDCTKRGALLQCWVPREQGRQRVLTTQVSVVVVHKLLRPAGDLTCTLCSRGPRGHLTTHTHSVFVATFCAMPTLGTNMPQHLAMLAPAACKAAACKHAEPLLRLSHCKVARPDTGVIVVHGGHLTTLLASLLHCRRPRLQFWAHLTSWHATSMVSAMHARQLQHWHQPAASVGTTCVSLHWPCSDLHCSCLSADPLYYSNVPAESSKHHPSCDGADADCAVSRVFANVQAGLTRDASSQPSNGFDRTAEAQSCGM